MTRLCTGRVTSRGSVPVRYKIFSSNRPDRRWGPFSLLVNDYHGLLHRGQSSWDVTLTSDLHLALKLRISGSVLHVLRFTITSEA
jgi:hypothetical protein